MNSSIASLNFTKYKKIDQLALLLGKIDVIFDETMLALIDFHSFYFLLCQTA